MPSTLPDSVLGTKCTAMNKTIEVPALMKLTFKPWRGGQKINVEYVC